MGSGPFTPDDMKINNWNGGRGVYFAILMGICWKLLTKDYSAETMPNSDFAFAFLIAAPEFSDARIAASTRGLIVAGIRPEKSVNGHVSQQRQFFQHLPRAHHDRRQWIVRQRDQQSSFFAE